MTYGGRRPTCAANPTGLLIDPIGEVLKLSETAARKPPLTRPPHGQARQAAFHRLEVRFMVVLDVDAWLEIHARSDGGVKSRARNGKQYCNGNVPSGQEQTPRGRK